MAKKARHHEHTQNNSMSREAHRNPVQSKPLAEAARPLAGATTASDGEGNNQASTSIQSRISAPIGALAACISPRTNEAINSALQASRSSPRI
ncbi:hypothetical protein PCANC_21398 [Puccinia coronata f. sp. avenae]|uniref:Uncharacterized protein n=1 Tax=Puccinia coronata f. sp. avenae TaxID=200324 RepID=A0A2N5SEN0_9BASI|nr:hypothetical protein PCANC_26951 [Puccinia coronata f. sp. avenae]PLW41025.1 hypothetical protein PCANC_21398 [Puccinia coronata f. sp. avenae]